MDNSICLFKSKAFSEPESLTSGSFCEPASLTPGSYGPASLTPGSLYAVVGLSGVDVLTDGLLELCQACHFPFGSPEGKQVDFCLFSVQTALKVVEEGLHIGLAVRLDRRLDPYIGDRLIDLSVNEDL